jgi:phosphatidylglycerophosphatase A
VKLAHFVLSYGGLGNGPVAPGTWGTLGAMVTAAALLRIPAVQADFRLVAVAWVVVAIGLTVLLTPEIEADAGKDPGVIVMDEVAGYWTTLLAFENPGWPELAAAFFVFRFFDIVKPWPANVFEKLPSGWGVVLDDVMGGIYGALLLLLAVWFTGGF